MYVDKRLSCICLFLDKQNVIIHNGICCSKLQTPPRHHIIMLSHMKMYSMHINSTTFRWMPWKLATSPHHYLTETRIISHGDGDGDDGTPKTNHITSIVNGKHTNYNENLKRIFIRLSCLCVRLLADYAHKFTGLRLRNVS